MISRTSRSYTSAIAFALPALFALRSGSAAASDTLPAIGYHDNSVAAGRDRAGVREVTFEIRRGLWRPNGPDRPGTRMLAFAEPGQPLRLPGPLVRVSAGTRLAITVRNGSDSIVVLRGLSANPTDSLVLAPGASGTVRSIADQSGTRFYHGTFAGLTLKNLRGDDAHLAGAIIVDPPDQRRRDAVFVISSSFHGRDSLGRVSTEREPIWIVNGRPWPFTQRLTGAVGDSLRYRVLNASWDAHPMHLHGTYFRVVARGGPWRDTTLAPDAERMVATELVPSGATMAMAWMPDRPGTWLMHCHFTSHVMQNIGFGSDSLSPAEYDARLLHPHGGDPNRHVEQEMGGLFMTITVPPPRGWTLPTAPRKVITFDVPRDSVAGDMMPAFSPTVTDGATVSQPEVRAGPGGMLLLHQGEPTTVRVRNRSGEHTAIHWHGMELENLYDGVVGLGGTPGKRTPAVAPGESFDAYMTPPRAGTFIYHTHLMEVRQQQRGLYGAMIVLPAGATWDASRDHVFVLGTLRDSGPMLNGAKVSPTLDIAAGVTHRMRFINVTTGSSSARWQLVRADSTLTEWTRHAKDAVDLPEAQRISVPARQAVSIGETYDVLFSPSAPGEYRLEIRLASGRLLGQQTIRVVARP
ncbi:multicopper oxidase domain-containing protein [Gemmatimonas phototrophica]|uniref:multicopper oxidase domain-containing protein n=1 Tax=Gemmatimonas phototrophica TaxID=1379270 RepID=UPI000A9BBF1B|nr:multicopper oxidase domain-containing protein [Gemmatimonas phototrophica]